MTGHGVAAVERGFAGIGCGSDAMGCGLHRESCAFSDIPPKRDRRLDEERPDPEERNGSMPQLLRKDRRNARRPKRARPPRQGRKLDKFIPSADRDFALTSRVFVDIIHRIRETLSLPEGLFEELDQSVKAFRDALALTYGASVRTRVRIVTKNEARKKAERLVREVANIVRADPRVSHADKVMLRIQGLPAARVKPGARNARRNCGLSEQPAVIRRPLASAARLCMCWNIAMWKSSTANNTRGVGVRGHQARRGWSCTSTSCRPARRFRRTRRS